MLAGKGGKVCVGYQVCRGLAFGQHFLKNDPMLAGRLNETCAGLIQPALDSRNGLIKGQGVFKDPGISAYADESINDGPAQTYRRSPGQLRIPPSTCRLVERALLVFGI
jgi:hypothetical protein